MKKNLIKLIAALAATALIAGVGSAVAAEKYGKPDKVTKWVFQPCFDSSDAGWENGIVPWIKIVEEATEGSIQIELPPAGAITSGSEAFGATEEKCAYEKTGDQGCMRYKHVRKYQCIGD